MKLTPATITPRPTGAKSNIPNASAPLSARNVAITMLGGVPTSVTSPPSREPNASGISSTEGRLPAPRATRITTGISSASAPMLFMNAESTATSPLQEATCDERRDPARETPRPSMSPMPSESSAPGSDSSCYRRFSMFGD